MRLYNPSELHVIKGAELPLSGQAVLELMKAVLERGNPFRFKARGWSMIPFIRDGDVITINPVFDSHPKIGEVVAFISPNDGKLIVHRIIAQHSTGFQVLGDSIDIKELMIVPRENIIGRVQKIKRNGHQTWLGLGPERVIIAWLSRNGSLNLLYQKLASLRREIIGRENRS